MIKRDQEKKKKIYHVSLTDFRKVSVLSESHKPRSQLVTMKLLDR